MANNGPVRFGILGAARIAPKALIDPARLVAGVELSAVAARDPMRAAEFARDHGVARALQRYEDVIGAPDIDAIYNPLPNSLHCEWTIKALRAGKDVLCEKPLAANSDEARQMMEAAAQSGRFLGEGFHYSYHPMAQRVRQLVQNGTLGQLLEVETHFVVAMQREGNIRFDWQLAGGALMDLGCYPLHMVRFYTGEEPRVLSAKAEVGPPKIDVTMDVRMELPSGAAIHMVCSMVAPASDLSFTVRGDRGELVATRPVIPHSGGAITVRTASGIQEEIFGGETSYTHQLRAFVAQLRGTGQFPTDGIDGVRNMRLIDEIYRAAGLPPRAT